MRRLFATLATAALIGAIATPSLADDHGYSGYGRHGYYGKYAAPHHYKRHERHERRAYRRHHRHGHGHRAYAYRRHEYRDDHGYAIAGALVGGVIAGQLLARPRYAPAYVVPVAAVRCQPITGVGYIGARRAEFGGSRCIDGYGRIYIAAGSEYFIRYID